MQKRHASAQTAQRQIKLQGEMRRLYRALRTDGLDVHVQWLLGDRQLYGDYVDDGEDGKIRVDPWKDAVGTLVHELYHHLERDKPERIIRAREEFIIRHASPRQMKRLLGYLFIRWVYTFTEQGVPARKCPFCGSRIAHLPLVETRRQRA